MRANGGEWAGVVRLSLLAHPPARYPTTFSIPSPLDSSLYAHSGFRGVLNPSGAALSDDESAHMARLLVEFQRRNGLGGNAPAAGVGRALLNSYSVVQWLAQHAAPALAGTRRRMAAATGGAAAG